MSQNQIIFFFVFISLAIYFIYYIKKRPAALLTFAVRSAAGLTYLWLFHTFCMARGLAAGPGYNPVTITLTALLGVPGAMLALAVYLFRFL